MDDCAAKPEWRLTNQCPNLRVRSNVTIRFSECWASIRPFSSFSWAKWNAPIFLTLAVTLQRHGAHPILDLGCHFTFIYSLTFVFLRSSFKFSLSKYGWFCTVNINDCLKVLRLACQNIQKLNWISNLLSFRQHIAPDIELTQWQQMIGIFVPLIMKRLAAEVLRKRGH